MTVKTITLASLANESAQDVFDSVAHHLLTQKRKSIHGTIFGKAACAYRGDDGLTKNSAAGVLIGDDEYSPKMESKGWRRLIDIGSIPTDVHSALIAKLQSVHDGCSVDSWVYALRDMASEECLSAEVIDAFAV